MVKTIEQEPVFELVKENLPIGFSSVDKEGRILDFNRAAEEITGYRKSEVQGKCHFELFHGTQDKDDCPLFKHTIEKQGQTVETEAMVRKKNGDLITISVTTFPLLDGEGSFLGGVELFRDVSALKKLERERKNILSMFAHDMKNPLNTSQGFLSRLLSGKAGNLSEKQQDYLQYVREDLDTIKKLILKFLEFSRFEAKAYKPNPKPFRIEWALHKHIETAKLEAEDKNIKIIFERPEELSEFICADPMMIDRVISNLLSNALKYTEPGGAITIELQDKDEEILVRIADSGIGISEDHISSIFDAFFRVSPDTKGTGLGLTIAKTVIEAHKGKIWVKSSPGEGSTFNFTLPKETCRDNEEASKIEKMSE